jgi:predicted nuclease with RNAse H fold
MRLGDIVAYCDTHDVVAAAIDAQLTIALSEETGFRSSDLQLRSMLPAGCREWVASINSLMAVPVRGRMLAEALGPVVGTIIETHPRASLLFALGEEHLELIRRYKKGPEAGAMVEELWQLWCKHYNITGCDPVQHDGALDALICATVAYLFHTSPALLLRLRLVAAVRMGRGVFYVVGGGK